MTHAEEEFEGIYTSKERSIRKKWLNRHLFQNHLRATVSDYGKRKRALTLEELEQFHDTLHEDGFVGVPHKHQNKASMKLKFPEPEAYWEDLMNAITGEVEE